MIFSLPLPPSVNHFKMYSATGRPFGSPIYRAWKKEAGWMILVQRAKQDRSPLTGDISVEIIFERKGDLDNRIKPLLDVLRDCHVMIDDKQVVRLLATFANIKGCSVVVEAVK